MEKRRFCEEAGWGKKKSHVAWCFHVAAAAVAIDLCSAIYQFAEAFETLLGTRNLALIQPILPSADLRSSCTALTICTDVVLYDETIFACTVTVIDRYRKVKNTS